MRADGAQVICIFLYTLVHEPVVASDVDTSVWFVGRAQFVAVKRLVEFIGYQKGNPFLSFFLQFSRKFPPLLFENTVANDLHILSVQIDK